MSRDGEFFFYLQFRKKILKKKFKQKSKKFNLSEKLKYFQKLNFIEI